MPRHLLTDLHLKNIKPDDTRKRLNDGDGLFLLLSVKGGAHAWRFSYTIDGTRKTLSLGTYPDTGLALARRKADEARAQVAAGTDPSDARKAARADREKKKAAQQREAAGLPALGSFEDVAREWLQEVHSVKVSPDHAERTRIRLEQHVFPWLGKMALSAEWAELDLDGGMWTIPGHRMKRNLQGKTTGPDHLVPLSRQAVELLRELQPLTGRRVLVFPGLRSPLRPALLHKAASRRHDPNLRRTHATAATGSVCARPI